MAVASAWKRFESVNRLDYAVVVAKLGAQSRPQSAPTAAHLLFERKRLPATWLRRHLA